jgi:hypothetical protein
MTPSLQYRPFIYVLGPNQDTRLASVAPGTTIEEVLLQTDDDAPFILTGRSVAYAWTSSLTQANLQGLKTRWTGPKRDYRMQDYLLESLQSVYYGQWGTPKRVAPGIPFPTRSILMLDLKNTGANTITNLSFYWFGFKAFPLGAVPAYTYPRRMASQTFVYPVPVTTLGVSETRVDQIFSVKPKADFVIRAGQGIEMFSTAGRTLAQVSIRLKDFAKNPYMSDYVPFSVLFGSGNPPSAFPVGPSSNFISPFGTGPGQPGVLYPEIYVPANHQLLYDIQRADGAGGSNQAESFVFNLIGSEVYDSSRLGRANK